MTQASQICGCSGGLLTQVVTSLSNVMCDIIQLVLLLYYGYLSMLCVT